jgi:hypothetical protein
MSVTGVSPTPRDLLFTELEKVVSSSILKGSESLCRLLRYLVERHTGHPGELIKEYQIATDVFGRSPDFDPRLDATVRVQTGRLRSKLAEYYALEGADDPLVLDLPKGSYSLVIHARHTPETPLPSPTGALHEPSTLVPVAVFWVLSVLCVGLLSTVIYLLLKHPPQTAAVAPPIQAPAVVQTFWHDFVDRPEDPWVVFSNAEFVGRPDTGMRYFDPKRDSRDAILDHYTGVGEVLAMHELDRVFTSVNHGVRVKRGRLLSLDDTRNNDLIFVGSPSENLTLREIPTTQDFVFRVITSGERKGHVAIVNLKPHPDEEKAYLGSKTLPITEDYALVGLVPGSSSAFKVMILAGTTTIGTQAAVEFVCHERELKELLARLGTVRPFEAVIRVKVAGGVPVATQLVALHARAN